MEDRVFDAALALYAAGGWQDFTFGAIARTAGVGKAALYKRWTDRGQLLREVLEARWYLVTGIDTGNLRDDLIALANLSFEMFAGPHGDIALRIRADLRSHVEVRDAIRAYVQGLTRNTRAIVHRAIERGQLQPEVSAALIADIIVGAISNRVGATPPALRTTMLEKRDDIVTNLVNLVLRGVGVGEG